MKAIDLLDEIKNQIICKPEEEQSDALTHKYGNQKDGFLTGEKFIFVMIVDTILEHKKISYFDRLRFVSQP